VEGTTETIRIEPGTPSGSVIRLRGQGIPHLGRRGRGDLYVTVVVETPKPRSKEERKLIEELAEKRGEQAEGKKPLAGKVRKLLDT
jgi:molecular chaperone DnaJ